MSTSDLREAVRRHRRYAIDKASYPIVWREKERIDDTVEEALVVILCTQGCAWDRGGGCTVCGYNKRRREPLPGIDAQAARVAEIYKEETVVKIYTSGSFLDPNEVTPESREKLLSIFKSSKKIVIESRPDVVSEENVTDIARIAPQAEVALGLESSNDEILSKCINKGFAVADYLKAVEAIRAHGLGVRTYLLLKPPFLSERRAIDDSVSSIRFASKRSDVVSLNPVTVHSGSLVEHLFRHDEYRPAWLWSVDRVLRDTAEVKNIVCSTIAFGKSRGPHNCGKCDGAFIYMAEKFNLSGNLGGEIKCGCRSNWERELVEGRLSGGAPGPNMEQ